MRSEEPPTDEPKIAARMIKVGFVVFCLTVIVILAAAWLVGDQANLPFDYEGFD